MANKKVRIEIPEGLTPGKATYIELEDREIALFNVNGAYHAIDDECPHAGWKLSEGELEGCTVTCLLHGAQFDVTTGESVGGFVCSAVHRYPVVVEGTELVIDLD